MPRAWILSHPEQVLEGAQADRFRSDLNRYLQGEALPYILGWWEFYGRQFHLSPQVLIPRPETERLVETALARLSARGGIGRIVDVGTGSGCIVVSVAAEFPERTYVAADLSMDALQVARRNSTHYRLNQSIYFVQADLLHGLLGPFDLLLANLPYIPTRRMVDLEVASREPGLALDGGDGGLEPLRRLAPDLKRALHAQGELILELDPEQLDEAESVVRGAFPVAESQRISDLAGRERILHVRRDGP
jgi:release factor glutamine methyltransferase